MSEEQFGLTNEGTDGVKQIPVEVKEATLVSTPAEMSKVVDAELITKGPDAVADFDETKAIVVPAKKKRGRPFKNAIVRGEAVSSIPEVTVNEFYCSTCREKYAEEAVVKMGAGADRFAIFCPNCTKSLGFFDKPANEKLEALHKSPSSK